MKDILPGEMEIRNRILSLIRETYARYGFTEIETPVVEHIENLTSKYNPAVFDFPSRSI